MHHLTYWLDLIKSLILTYKPSVTGPVGPGRPSINYPPESFLGRHFIEKIP